MDAIANRFNEIKDSELSSVKLSRLCTLRDDLLMLQYESKNNMTIRDLLKGTYFEIDNATRELDKAADIRRNYF